MKRTLAAGLAIALLFILGVETVVTATAVSNQGSTTSSKIRECPKGDPKDCPD